MRATTSLGAFYRAFHADTHPDHDPDECGCSEGLKRLDMGQAVKFEELLSAQGWMLVPTVSIPRSAPKGDPASTWQSIDDLPARALSVLLLLRNLGPSTDDELFAAYGSWPTLTRQAPSSIRTRRSELVRAGMVAPVMEDGKQKRRPTRAGGTGGVWAVTEKGAQRTRGEAA